MNSDHALSLGKVRSPAAVIGLCIVTLGVYYLVWYYKINAEIRRHDPDVRVLPWLATLAVLIPVANVVGAFSTAARIRRMQRDCGERDTISPVVALLLFWLGGFGYPIYVTWQLSEHWSEHQRALRCVPTPPLAAWDEPDPPASADVAPEAGERRGKTEVSPQ